VPNVDITNQINDPIIPGQGLEYISDIREAAA